MKRPGALTAPLLAELLDDVVAVSEEEISETLVLLAERAKLVVEGRRGGGARRGPGRSRRRRTGRRVAILSGGNIDATLLISVMRHGLTHAGRSLVLRSRVPDRPGELIELLQLIAAERVNVVSVEHHREGLDIPIGETEVELTLLTRDTAHCDELRLARRAVGLSGRARPLTPLPARHVPVPVHQDSVWPQTGPAGRDRRGPAVDSQP